MKYEDPYQDEMSQAMAELLKMLKDPKIVPATRLKIAEAMGHISFHALQADTIRDIATSTGDKAEQLTSQLKKLNKDEDEE